MFFISGDYCQVDNHKDNLRYDICHHIWEDINERVQVYNFESCKNKVSFTKHKENFLILTSKFYTANNRISFLIQTSKHNFFFKITFLKL